MIIEYTNTTNPKKKRFLPTVLIVLSFLLLIPATLIFIGKQNKKDPTGNYLSPLPQGELAQTTPTPTPENSKTLVELVSFSQAYLNKAISLSLITPQTQSDKQQIISYLEQSLDYSNQAVLTYPQEPQTYLLRAQVLTSISQTNPDALIQAEKDIKTAQQLANNQPVSLPQNINPLDVLPSQQASLPQDLIIASPQQENTASISTQNNSNAITTTTILPAGQIQLEINNSQITSDSYIYIIPQTKTNQTIFVASKKDGSFTLATNKPFDTDISLDYWIINH